MKDLGSLSGQCVRFAKNLSSIASTETLPRVGSRLGTTPLSNSWIIIIIGLYIAFNRTPNMDCYWVGAVPKV